LRSSGSGDSPSPGCQVGPKRNSFRDASQLADPEEFCARILVAKNAQRTPDFAVIARLESLIVGESMDEAVARAEKYHDVGADCLLIHSRAADLAASLLALDAALLAA